MLVNTAPFIVSGLGYCLLKETIDRVEIVAMVCSFVGVVLIASAKPDDSEVQDNYHRLLGIGFLLITAFCYSGVTIMTRAMQDVNFAVLLFYYGAFSVVTLFTILCAESLIY